MLVWPRRCDQSFDWPIPWTDAGRRNRLCAMTPERILAHFDAGTPWPAADAAAVPDDLQQAYEAAFALRRLREARGEKVVGYKIGFTNRTIWERYAVFGPIWGPVYDSTLSWCEDAGEITLAPSSLPRLEPECALGMRAAPP